MVEEGRYEEVRYLANRLNELVDREVNLRSKESEFQEAYYYLKACIEQKLVEAQSLIENFRDRSLTINTIEAEGFLRCAQELAEDLEYSEGMLSGPN